MSTPVIFLCFANEYHEGRYLDNLVKEYKSLYAALAPVSADENPADSNNILCEVVVRQNVTIGDIVDVFQNKMYRGRIAIFHYGGHADGYQLLLEGKDGENKVAHGSGLISLLSKQDNLKLVFLNGCSTQKMAQDLVARGIPAVIGTATSIADDVALSLSERFYKGLAQGLTISGAWETSKDEVQTFMDSDSNYRSLYLPGVTTVPDRFPWDIEYRDDAAKETLDNWNLPDVASQPLYGLPSISGKYPLPPSPFLFLKPYEKEHAEIFFGRSYYIRDLYLKIAEPSSPPMILFYGESGAGKSSLLDAGLRPRLEAARKAEDLDEAAFEVHYQRRNAETGLVGTLSEMLSYTLESEEEPEAEEEVADPNSEKLGEIETLIDQLEGEERESFRTFLARQRARRSGRQRQQAKRHLYEDGQMKAHTGAQLRAAWLEIEKVTGRKLILILDQVEETFARPHPDMPNELEDFLSVMKEIWAPAEAEGDAAIKGRIILGYREEFNARIEARIKEYELARTTVFLEHLHRKDILDIFSGLQSEVVRQNYNIHIEPNLPERVADDLLKGRKSTGPGQAPVAPVLQLLLTKLWNKAYKESSHEPTFSIDSYNEVQSQGREMEEFFYEQLAKIYNWDSDVVDSGLVLDILQFHVTDLGTSGRRHIDEMKHRYRHLPDMYEDRPEIIFNLVEKLKEVFLLVDNSRGFTSLPHDTLAPIVMREYNRSDKLGQRSTRILDTKRPDFEQAEDKQKSKVRLDDNDLEVVEGGILGMRALSDTEYQLLEISKVEREKRLRLRRQLVQGGLVTGVIILILALVVGSLSVNMVEQLRKAAVSHAYEEGLELISSKETEGLKPEELKQLRIKLNSFAYQHDETRRTDVIEELYGLAHEHILEEGFLEAESEEAPEAFNIRIRSENRITSLDYQPGVGALAAFGDGNARFIPIKGKSSQKFSIKPEDSEESRIALTDLRFSADGEAIQAATYSPEPGSYNSGRIAVYNVENTLMPAPLIPITIKHDEPEYLYYEAVEDPIARDYLEYSDGDGQMLIGFYDCLSGSFKDYTGDQYFYHNQNDLYFKYIEYTFFNGITEDTLEFDSLFFIRIWDRPQQQINRLMYEDFDRALGMIGMEDYQREQFTDFYSPYFEDDAVEAISCELTHLEYTPQYDFKVLDQDGREIAQNSISGRGLFFFRLLSPELLLTLEPDYEGESNTAVIRSVESLEELTEISHEDPITDIGLTGDKKHFITFSKNEARAWNFEGQLQQSIELPDMRHRISPTSGSFIAFNKEMVKHWSASAEKDSKPFQLADANVMRIITARFIPDDPLHLAIGIARTANAPENARDSVLYWNVAEGAVEYAYPMDREYQLVNAKMSNGGTELAAWVKDRPDSKKSKEGAQDKLVFKAREGVGGFRRLRDIEPAENERIMFSKGQRFVMLHDHKADLVKVFSLSGDPQGSYEFKKGFMVGFNHMNVITPDDAYMIGHNANTAMLWTLDAKHLTAIDNFLAIEAHQLSFSDKREYNLHSIMDQIPGYDSHNRNVSILLLIFALLYIVGRTSNYLYQAFLSKDYQKAGLYGGIFVLFAILLLAMWSDTEYEESRLLLIDYTLLSVLVLSIPEFIQRIRTGKYRQMILPGLATLFFGAGLIYFNWREVKHDSYMADESMVQALLMVIGFVVLLVGPTYLALRSRSRNQTAAYYYWQLPVIFVAGFLVWILINFLFEESEIPFPDLLLLAMGLAGGIWMVIRQGKIYRQEGKRLSMFLYSILGLAFILLIPSSYDPEAAIPANIILVGMLMLLMLGIETARQKSSRTAFFILIAGIVMLSGMLINAAIGVEDDTRLYDYVSSGPYFLFMLLIPAIVYGIRFLLRRSGRNAETGRSPWLPRLAGVGLGVAALLFAIWANTALEPSYEDDYAYEDDYYYDEDYEDAYYAYEQGPYDEDSMAVPVVDPGIPEADPQVPDSDITYDPEAESEETEDLDSENLDENYDEIDEIPEPPTEDPSQPAELDLSDLNERQRLIVGLFGQDEETRTASLNSLLGSYLYDQELLPELLPYNVENPQVNEGTWNTIYILERMSDDMLLTHQDMVSQYLDWASQLGYGPSTMDRIQNLQARLSP